VPEVQKDKRPVAAKVPEITALLVTYVAATRHGVQPETSSREEVTAWSRQ
jgi:hypothetical protein